MSKNVDRGYFDSIDGGRVAHALREAQNLFFAHDRQLLVNDASERSLCGRFAYHLTGIFPEFHVDIEYNRNHAEEDFTKKIWDMEAIRALLESRGVRNLDERLARADDDGLIVLPDIIVHIRDLPVNLLIIEAKKSTSRISESVDREKLRALKTDLQYRHAAFIRFPTDRETPERGDGPDWFNLQ